MYSSSDASADSWPLLTATNRPSWYSELVTITVLDPNDNCPVLAPIGNREASPGQTLAFTVSGADPDPGQTISFSASFLPPGASFNPATRTFTWTPTTADVGVRLGTVFEVRDSAFHHGGGEAWVYEVTPDKALGFEKGDPAGQTRWRFDPRSS